MTQLSWQIEPGLHFLNHGSFGAVPAEVHERQSAVRRQFERQPIRFVLHELEPLLDRSRARLAAFVGAAPEDIAFVTNATEGVNTILRSVSLAPGDELLTTDHAYNACANALHAVAERTGARVVVARVPFPLASETEVVDAIVSATTRRTRLAMIDHITSPTGLVLPIEQIVRTLADRGVDTLVDGAHGPGMVPLDLDALGAAYYTGNCHKWVCAPKGAAFLHVRRDHQGHVRPLVISHGANASRADRSRFQLEFDWCGTYDPSAHICIETAIDLLGAAFPGGWPALMARNRREALRAQAALCATLQCAAPAPAAMIGSLAAVPLAASGEEWTGNPGAPDPLAARLLRDHRIEVPIFGWPVWPRRVLRVSIAAHTEWASVEALLEALHLQGVRGAQ